MVAIISVIVIIINIIKLITFIVFIIAALTFTTLCFTLIAIKRHLLRLGLVINAIDYSIAIMPGYCQTL